MKSDALRTELEMIHLRLDMGCDLLNTVGRPRSEADRKAISVSLTGRIFSDSHRANMSSSHKKK